MTAFQEESIDLEALAAGKPGDIAIALRNMEIGDIWPLLSQLPAEKAALALHQRVLPPTINVNAPNSKMDWENSPFYVNTHARPWVRSADHPRRAAVSAFGFGGSNYHAILEEHVATPAKPFCARARRRTPCKRAMPLL